MNEEQVRKGRKAEELLGNEAFSSALEKIKGDQFWIFQSSKPEESAKRELAWATLQCIENLKIEIVKQIDNAKVAQRAIERAQKSF